MRERLLHLADLVVHAAADVEGQREAQGTPLAAEERDLLPLAVLEIWKSSSAAPASARPPCRGRTRARGRCGCAAAKVGSWPSGGVTAPGGGRSARRGSGRAGAPRPGATRRIATISVSLAPASRSVGLAGRVERLAEAAALQLEQDRLLADAGLEEADDVRGGQRGVGPHAARHGHEEKSGRRSCPRSPRASPRQAFWHRVAGRSSREWASRATYYIPDSCERAAASPRRVAAAARPRPARGLPLPSGGGGRCLLSCRSEGG